MGEIEKVVFIKNAVETLGYFSAQLAAEMERCGIGTYFLDYDDLEGTLRLLPEFAEKGRTALLTFNFIGLGGEEAFLRENGCYIWEKYEMRYFNILVDHPFYYHKKLEKCELSMTLFCVDREHVAYVKRFYPEIPVHFLPLAGNVRLSRDPAFLRQAYDGIWSCAYGLPAYEDRKYDLVFTANYVPLSDLENKIALLEPEYQQFYREIIEDLCGDPAQSVDAVMERHIAEELGPVSEPDLRAALSGMILIDLYVRTYFRGELIRGLAEQDIKIHVFGDGWNRLPCRKPWNIISSGSMVDSSVCVQAIRDAKICLNIMPWFKDGAHDRVFTAMLQKTVSLTDDSRFLRGEFTDGEEIVFFPLKDTGRLAQKVHWLLDYKEEAGQIAENGYRRSYERHTWRERAHEVMRYF